MHAQLSSWLSLFTWSPNPRRVVALFCVALAAHGSVLAQPVEPVPAVVRDIKFRDFFRTPIGAYGLEMSDQLRAAAGQRVRLLGYMVAQEEAPVGQFLLTPVPIRMSEHADGDADDLPASTVVVLMPAVDRVRPIAHTSGLMQLTGVLEVGRQSHGDDRVSWLRLRLDPPIPSR